MCEWNKWLVVGDIVLAIVINTSATLLSGAALEFSSWYPYTCVAFGTNVVLQMLLPVAGASRVLARWADGTRWGWAVAVFFENLIFVTCISLMEALVQVGPGPGMLTAWWSTYVPLVCVGYVTSLVLCRALPASPQPAADPA